MTCLAHYIFSMLTRCKNNEIWSYNLSLLLIWAVTLLYQVIARILFVDPFSRAIGLTMNPYLIQNKAPPLVSLHILFSFSLRNVSVHMLFVF